MIKIFKTYTPMILSIMFFGMYSFLLSLLFNGLEDYFNNAMFMVFLFFGILGCFFIEWFYFMIQAATSKTLKDKALWAVLIYLFNVFIIPYYNFKHVAKIKKLKINMIIYIVLSIVAIAVGILVPLSIKNPESTVKIYSKDKTVEFIFHGDYVEKATNYDVYVSDYNKAIHFGAFIYNTSEADVTADSILKYRENWLTTTRKNVKLVDEMTDIREEKVIYSIIYYGEHENIISTYKISAVVFKGTDYIIETIQTLPYYDYEENKEDLEQMLIDIKLLK